MHVYCTDGTVFDCQRYDVNEYGLVLYGQEKARDRDRYEDDKSEQIGFVPHDRLWYVLPHGVEPAIELGTSQQVQPQAQPPAQGPSAQQQQFQGAPVQQPQAQAPSVQQPSTQGPSVPGP